VSKQVGNAVERNRVRRRLRELIRLAPPTALCAGHDYVLIGRRAALKLAFDTMTKELSGALRRVHGSGKYGADKNGSDKYGAGKNSSPRSGGAGTGGAGELPPHRAGRSNRGSGKPQNGCKTGPVSTSME
jgi:ribonuclease P protein component